jgi:Uncharacterized conserved protein (DUF2358)
MRSSLQLVASFALLSTPCTSFQARCTYSKLQTKLNVIGNKKEASQPLSSYNDTRSGSQSSKGIVSLLTNLINAFSNPKAPTRPLLKTPSTPLELMERIRDDYVQHNYLWTGAIDVSSFCPNCRFTDPTLSFTGTDVFLNNVQNLMPIINALVGTCESKLLSIELTNGFVVTRWNMVGELTNVPWKPCIDVVGQTKFWYNENCQVYSYDERWEIPLARALLQLLVPGRSRDKDPMDELK